MTAARSSTRTWNTALSDNAVLTVIGYVTIGKQDAEFEAFGSGAIARARLYF